MPEMPRLPYPVPSSAAVTARMRLNRKVDSRPETRLRSYLHRAGLRFRKNRSIDFGEMSAVADVVFPREHVAVFMDGCFWHSCPDHGTVPRVNRDYWLPKLARTRERDRQLPSGPHATGWLIIRVWEHDPLQAVASSVFEAVESRRRVTYNQNVSSEMPWPIKRTT